MRLWNQGTGLLIECFSRFQVVWPANSIRSTATSTDKLAIESDYAERRSSFELSATKSSVTGSCCCLHNESNSSGINATKCCTKRAPEFTSISSQLGSCFQVFRRLVTALWIFFSSPLLLLISLVFAGNNHRLWNLACHAINRFTGMHLFVPYAKRSPDRGTQKSRKRRNRIENMLKSCICKARFFTLGGCVRPWRNTLVPYSL